MGGVARDAAVKAFGEDEGPVSPSRLGWNFGEEDGIKDLTHV